MRYRVEFLRQMSQEGSVCHARSIKGADLLLVELQAHVWGAKARAKYGAGGFQVRDLDDNGRIVSIERLDETAPVIH